MSRYTETYKKAQWLKALAEKYNIPIILTGSASSTKWSCAADAVILPWSRLSSLTEEDLEVEILKVRDEIK